MEPSLDLRESLAEAPDIRATLRLLENQSFYE